jgi:hypothetical protein
MSSKTIFLKAAQPNYKIVTTQTKELIKICNCKILLIWSIFNGIQRQEAVCMSAQCSAHCLGNGTSVSRQMETT